MKNRRIPNPPTVVNVKGPACNNRQEAEGFVKTAFAHAYDARVNDFMPTLMGLRSNEGQLLAVLGLREARNHPLYLENYLSASIEVSLSKALKLDYVIDRNTLIEVGNFAVGGAGGGRWLITALTAYLYGDGHQWAVFTCGPELQNAFSRLGVELVDMGAADAAMLPASDNNDWGHYYDKKPRVMAANVAQSHQALSRFQQQENALYLMWDAALHAGQRAA